MSPRLPNWRPRLPVRARSMVRDRLSARLPWRRARWVPPNSNVADPNAAPEADDSDTLVLRRQELAKQELAGQERAKQERASQEGASHTVSGAVPRTRPRPRPELAVRAWSRVLATGGAVVLSGLGVFGLLAVSAHTQSMHRDRVWPTLANVTAVVIALICLLQWRCWLAARREWLGRGHSTMKPWATVSAVAAGVSVLAGGFEVFAIWRAAGEPELSDATWWWGWASAAASVAAALLGGSRGLFGWAARELADQPLAALKR